MNIVINANKTIDDVNVINDFSFYPNQISLVSNKSNNHKTDVSFNILPGKTVKETLFVKKYILNKREIQAVFDRSYVNKMIKSPSHLIFLSSLVHLQKMIYIYMLYELGLPLNLDNKEYLKIWPTKIDIELPKLITKTSDIVQSIRITTLRKTGDKSYFGKCISSIEGKTLIKADAVIYIL